MLPAVWRNREGVGSIFYEIFLAAIAAMEAVMITPILETERILLRPLSASDAETIFKNWAADPGITKYMRWNTHQSVRDTEEWLAAEERAASQGESYNWGFVYKENDELFGSGGLIYNDETKMFDIGYIIMKKYWGQGFAAEAARAFIDFAVKELGKTAFFGAHAKDNPGSGKVMEKVGFVYQKDGTFASFDGKRIFESREYVLNAASVSD